VTLTDACVTYSFLSLTPTHCNTLQHTTTHCNTPQHTATHRTTIGWVSIDPNGRLRALWNPLPHAHAHCKTRQHTATHRNTLHHRRLGVRWCPLVPMDACVTYLFISPMYTQTAKHCNALQHRQLGVNRPSRTPAWPIYSSLTRPHTLQQTTTHCNTPHHTVPQAIGGPMALTNACVNYMLLSLTPTHIATNCNTLQHTATHHNTLYHRRLGVHWP